METIRSFSVSSAVTSALYLAASAAVLRDLIDAARAFGDVEVVDTPSGCRFVGGGHALDLELSTDAYAAVARTRERYFDFAIVDARHLEESALGEQLVTTFIDGVRAERDRERHFRRDRVLALIAGADGRTDRVIFALGQRRIGGYVREHAGAEGRRAFFGELWARCREVPPPVTRRKALCAAGGGVTGIYYELGVLKCFDDAFGDFRVNDFDMFFGISAGSIVSSLLANGFAVEELIRRMEPGRTAATDAFDLELRLRNLTFTDAPRRLLACADHIRRYIGRVAAGEEPWSMAAALSQLSALVGPFFRTGDKESQLAAALAEPGRTNDFRSLPRKLYIGATDQDLREHVLFGAEPHEHVPISRAVQASSAIHPFLAPVDIDGRRYTDGFVTRTTNIAAAIERGADLIFILDPFLPLISDDPGFNDRHSFLWVLTQDYKTIAYSRYERVSRTLLDLHPNVTCYSFLPSNRMRRLMASNPVSTGNFDQIVTQAYTSTYRRLRRMEYKLGPELAAHGIRLDLAPAQRRARAIEGAAQPAARVLWE
jgi:NTE family protein